MRGGLQSCDVLLAGGGGRLRGPGRASQWDRRNDLISGSRAAQFLLVGVSRIELVLWVSVHPTKRTIDVRNDGGFDADHYSANQKLHAMVALTALVVERRELGHS